MSFLSFGYYDEIQSQLSLRHTDKKIKKRKNLHMLSDFYPIYLQAGPKALFREFTLGSSTHLYLTTYSTQELMPLAKALFQT